MSKKRNKSKKASKQPQKLSNRRIEVSEDTFNAISDACGGDRKAMDRFLSYAVKRATDETNTLPSLSDKKEPQFTHSKNPILHNSDMSEKDLEVYAQRLNPHIPLSQIAKEGYIERLQWYITEHFRSPTPSGAGSKGSADERLEDAYNKMKASGENVTPSTLRARIGTNYYTARKWLAINAPGELED